MRTISVFYDQTRYTFTWLSTLLWAQKYFKKQQFIIKFEYSLMFGLFFDFNIDSLLKKSKKKYDIVILAFHHNHDFFNHDYMTIIKNFNKNSNRVIWLDTADSCGNCKFEVLSYVDKYLKKQLYKDINNYRREVYGYRLHCEYYHKLLGIDDDIVKTGKQIFLDEKYYHKIGLSWNVGIGNLFMNSKIQVILDPKRKNNLLFCKSIDLSDRKYLTHFRGSSWSPIAGYQRRITKEKMEKYSNVVPDFKNKCSRKQYLLELKNSKSVTSPFGWGEICTRDFEAFYNGCILLKPDMSHLITFPNYYTYDKYVSIDWNYDNYDDILNNLEKYYKIALKGYDFYKESVSEHGKELFVNHLLKAMDV